jgi:hypothetical protein
MVAWCCSACLHSLQAMITSSARMSCRCLSNAWACLGNMRASMHAIVAKPHFISMAHGLQSVMGHVSAPEPTTKAVWFRAEGRVSALDPSLAARRGPMLRHAWQCRPPPGWRGRVRSLWARGSTGALLGREEGSGALDMWQR